MLACVPEAIVTYKRLLDAEADVTPGEALRNSPRASKAFRRCSIRRSRISVRRFGSRSRD